MNKPAGYGSVRIYAYDSSEAQNEAYIASSDSEATIPSGRDTFAVQQIENGIILCAGWTNFQTASGNTGLQYSCKGIKAANTVTVAGGNINIISRDDGIHANSEEILESMGEKGLGNVTILAGVLTIQSDDDGIHADQDLYIRGGTLNVGNAYEGLEANRLYLSDGSVFVAATDDALNANNKGAYAGYIEISGGYLEAETHNGDTDTLDANGTIRIIGGTVILKNGQMSGIGRNGGNFDADRGVSIEGGTVIAVGCVGEQLNGAVINMNQMWERGAYVIRDSKGNEIAAFSLGNAYQAYQFWSDRFVSGETYTVYRDSEQVFGFQK